MAQDPLFIAIMLLCLGVVVILALGLGSFAKGGKDASVRSNKMMRLRIIVQACAVVLILILVAIRGGGGN